MEKHDIFTFKAPNGVEVTAIVLNKTTHFNATTDVYSATYLCYTQNRIFTYIYTERALPVCIGKNEYGENRFEYQYVSEYEYGEVIVDYAILPDYDEVLKNFKSKEL